MPALKKAILFCFFIFPFLFPYSVLAQVVINEFLVNPNPEWVEFYNASESADFLRDYWLDDDPYFSDDSGNSKKKNLSSLNVTNPSYPYLEGFKSFFNNDGDYVVIFNPEGDLIDSYQYKESPGSGVSIGRFPDSSGDFKPLEGPTKGATNSNPLPSLSPSPEPSSNSSPEPSLSPSPGDPSPSLRGVELTTTLSGEVLGQGGLFGGLYLLGSPASSSESSEGSRSLFFPRLFLMIGLALLAVAGAWAYYSHSVKDKKVH